MTSPENNTSDKRICLGKITAPHGVKGLVKFFAYGEDPTLVESIDNVFTSKNSDNTISITLKNKMGKYILAYVDGCDTREGSDALKGTELWVNRDDLPVLDDDGEFYIEDLGGLIVLNTNKEEIGTVVTIQNYGAGDLLEIKPPSGASYFVPFQDEYVHDINLDEKCVTVENAENFIIE